MDSQVTWLVDDHASLLPSDFSLYLPLFIVFWVWWNLSTVWFDLCTPLLHFYQNESMRLIIMLLPQAGKPPTTFLFHIHAAPGFLTPPPSHPLTPVPIHRDGLPPRRRRRRRRARVVSFPGGHRRPAPRRPPPRPPADVARSPRPPSIPWRSRCVPGPGRPGHRHPSS